MSDEAVNQEAKLLRVPSQASADQGHIRVHPIFKLISLPRSPLTTAIAGLGNACFLIVVMPLAAVTFFPNNA